MGSERRYLEEGTDDQIKTIFNRALRESHETEMSETLYMAIIKPLREMLLTQDEKAILELKMDHKYILPSSMLGELAKRTISGLVEECGMEPEPERIASLVNLLYGVLLNNREWLAERDVRRIASEKESSFREGRVNETRMLSLTDYDSVMKRLRFMGGKPMRDMLLRTNEGLNQLIVSAFLEIDPEQADVAREFLGRLLGDVVDDPKSQPFINEVGDWFKDPKNIEAIKMLKKEAEAKREPKEKMVLK